MGERFRHGGGGGFRPLFWGFVFNEVALTHFNGIQFFTRFRPLFWGFVFNAIEENEYDDDGELFSSPLLGICF